MKLLVLYQARRPEAEQPGYYDGFERLAREGVLQWHRAVGYLGADGERGWKAMWDDAARAAEGADAIFLQFFHADMPDPSEGIRRLRELPGRPLIFCSLGDPFGRWDHRVPRSMRVASALSEVTFLTGMGYVAGQLKRAGGSNLVLMPNGCCQARFAAEQQTGTEAPEFDVAFIGNRMTARNPVGHFFRTARRRAEFVKVFTRRYGKRFALFGRGWEENPCWQGAVPYEAQLAAYGQAAVIAGGTPNGEHEYYTSDRLLIALASGVPVVDWAVPGVELLWRDGGGLRLAHSIAEMARLCDRLLELTPGERSKIGMAARQHVLAEHTQYHRCRQMVEIVTRLREARRKGTAAALPALPFLPAEQDLTAAPAAVMAWRG